MLDKQVDSKSTISSPTAPVIPIYKKMNPWMISTFVLLALIIIIGSWYVVHSLAPISLPKSNQNQNQTQQPTLTQTLISRITYNNKKYRYSLIYPSNFTISENGYVSGDVLNTDALVIYDPSKFDKNQLSLVPSRFNITVRAEYDTFKSVVDEHYNEVTTNRLTEDERQEASKNFGFSLSKNIVTSPISETSFKGFPSYMYSVKGSVIDDGAAGYGTSEQERQYIWISAYNNYYLISFPHTDATMSEIFDSFEFL